MSLPPAPLPKLKVLGDFKNHDKHTMQIITGRHDFATDRMPGNKYYGAIRPATITRGKVLKVDGTEAMKIPGVKAVVTYDDVPVWSSNVLYWGQPIAAVIADCPYTAERGLPLLKIEYAPATPVIDPDEAIKPGAALSGVWPDRNTNLQASVDRGDYQAGLAASEEVIDTTFGWTTVHQHNTLEPHAALAWWVGDDCYVWAGNQNPHGSRSTLVNSLGVPAHKIHFFSHFIGGALGSKGGGEIPAAAHMSRYMKGYPVQVFESRKANLLFNTRQFQVRSEFKIGAKKDGTFTALDANFFAMGGVNSATPSGSVNFALRTTYTIPDAKMRVTLIGTNSPNRGFYRCVPDPPGNINSDTAIDKLATKLGMDPYELRMKNLRPADAKDQDEPYRQWANGGPGVAVRMCFEKVFKESDYASKKHAPGAHTRADGKLHGIAIVGHLDSHVSVSGATRGGIVTMTDDGKCLVNMGGARATQGGPTMACHMVAETLGLLYDDVNIGEWGHTDTSLSAGGQNGSGFTGGAGSAFVRAAEDVRAKVFAAAITKAGLKEITGITVNDLDAENSEIFYKPDPSKRITYRVAMQGSGPMAGTAIGWNAATAGGRSGLQRTREGLPPVGSAVNVSGACATCVELTVDPETGEVEILGLWNAVDTGRTVSKRGTLKELDSGCELIVWQALYAGDVFDPKTAALIGSHYDETMMMTTMDLDVTKLTPYDIESDNYAGPWGAHGIGEPCSSNASAVICAIYNATGKWVNPRGGPTTPDIVLESIGKAEIKDTLYSR